MLTNLYQVTQFETIYSRFIKRNISNSILLFKESFLKLHTICEINTSTKLFITDINVGV